MTEPTTGLIPAHNHSADHPWAQGCPGCMAAGRINPDTGTPWPSLSEHGEQVIEETAGRFHDLLDGPHYDPALRTALTEAYLRGVMHGRLAEVADAKAKAQVYERAAEEHIKLATSRMGQPEGHGYVVTSLGDAERFLGMAQGLRSIAGSR